MMDYEQFEQDRSRFEQLLRDLEANRAEIEARGDDVDLIIAEVREMWNQYEQAHQKADVALEKYLQSIADQVDAGEELLNRVRVGRTWWESALEKASDAAGSDRVQIWEGYQAWKEMIRSKVQQPSAHSNNPDYRRVMDEALRLLED